ncbi:hypothetical protein N7516_008625 [Penicillium verrucosum]|uniref:uncharacterized protein n=1 Tax=Penicillium verrucosum TaxID=60171 RepID=UPI0025455913|nr:uncharacterized protein N7516_008625 [Penicillium verrucosum]KAJ5926852.1 hypothetical protein N7516_008625 [Penicillium verrucosum]
MHQPPVISQSGDDIPVWNIPALSQGNSRIREHLIARQGKDRLCEVAVKFAGFSRSLGFIKSRGLEQTQLANSKSKNRD